MNKYNHRCTLCKEIICSINVIHSASMCPGCERHMCPKRDNTVTVFPYIKPKD